MKRNSFLGILSCFFLILSAYIGLVMVQFPCWLLFRNRPQIWNKCLQLQKYGWMGMISFMIQSIFSVEFHLYRDQKTRLKRNESALIVCNHFSRLDWLYLWPVFLNTGQLKDLVIVLKDDLGNIPVFGWAMKMWKFLFFKRSLDIDQKETVTKLADFGKKSLLLFPEGTDLSRYNIEKSTQYALNNNLPVYKNVLHPKTAGFAHILDSYSNFDAIYDLTIKYEMSGGLRPNEMTLIRGQYPTKVHVFLDRYETGSVLRDKKQWVKDRWRDKEKLLYQIPTRNDSRIMINYNHSVFLTIAWLLVFVFYFYLMNSYFYSFILYQFIMIVTSQCCL